MIDSLLLVSYLVAALVTRRAIIPALAFALTQLVFVVVATGDVSHMGFLAVYLCLIPLSNTRVAWGMLLSAIVNFMAVAYFLSPLYLEGFALYFAILMTMVNLYILFTIFRSVKSEGSDSVDFLAFGRVMDLCNIQTHTKTRTGR